MCGLGVGVKLVACDYSGTSMSSNSGAQDRRGCSFGKRLNQARTHLYGYMPARRASKRPHSIVYLPLGCTVLMPVSLASKLLLIFKSSSPIEAELPYLDIESLPSEPSKTQSLAAGILQHLALNLCQRISAFRTSMPHLRQHLLHIMLSLY